MANRLSVVIVQSAGAQPERQQKEEQLLVQLMAARGLDPVLVRPADQWTADRTDLLPLQAARAELVVCAWSAPEEMRGMLERFGVSSRRATAGNSTGERIHVFDLGKIGSVEDLVSDCVALLRASQTPVVQIGMPGPDRRPQSAQAAPRLPLAARSADHQEPPATIPAPQPTPGDRQRDAELERLVDQLNDELL